MDLSQAQAQLDDDVAVFGIADDDWDVDCSTWSGASPYLFDCIGPRSLGYAPEMLRALRRFDPDIVHLHGLWMWPGQCVSQWSRETGRPYVLSVHGMLSETALSYSRQKKRIALKLFQNRVFREMRAVHVTSSQELTEIRNFGLSTPAFLAVNGVNEFGMSDRQTEKCLKSILSLGRVHRKKGLSNLILAWASLEEKFPDWCVDIVGPDEGGETERLKKLVANLDLKRVRFRDAVYGEERISVLANADIFALPTLSENFALTVAESLLQCVPVIASKGAPWGQLEAERCGRWVDIGSRPMADALFELMRLDDAERVQMGIRGRDWMRRDFNWSKIAVEIRNRYCQLIENDTQGIDFI
jgi:glycosyltransferase involved in cell wall biosynthesis